MKAVLHSLYKYLYWSALPRMGITDVLEIIIISVIVYQIIQWVQTSRAWMIVKGIIVLLVFTLFASIFKLNTILWLLSNSLGFAITAAVIVFQPELRRALEELGRKNFLSSFFSTDVVETEDYFSEKVANEISKACVEMAKKYTGALIVIEQDIALGDYERTGIMIDGIVTSQLLINIFEHNTPLHDGAIIVRGNRIVSATCYLPLTDSLDVTKELGTRHRAAIGISEVSDSYTVVVSEETGQISIAHKGHLFRGLTDEKLKQHLNKICNKKANEKNKFKIWKGRRSHEEKAGK